ncbi:YhcH/YjgK/YiaL family protein [Mariniphaga anaerophila]|uniref:YhcH/YjgK/YiaL family protein n=1 Tax=Mariniphaga anaerophila TaxID=1484053 RepID=A0A1M5EYT9_9BACT|nr:YhcH/YjgK/YiaL family protein [Mariniphaga anaerophila]SHF84414.1 YhcH/YjgK/YiaL family protein [Mariniphaga anaerophila]
MKNQLVTVLAILIFMTTACTQSKKSGSENIKNDELNEWFEKGEWKEGWHVQPDESINQEEFALQYSKHPQRWAKAFSFLNNEDLAALSPGRYELEGSDLFVNVDEYVTKNEEDTRFEAHRQYADIQYLVFGEEKIGVVPLENTFEVDPYDKDRDIAFFKAEQNNYRNADSIRFFVFFPDDAHRPCFKASKNSKVRKVVVKVRIN